MTLISSNTRKFARTSMQCIASFSVIYYTVINNNIAKGGKYKTSDIGAKGPEFPHNIYHFVVDPETFETTHVKFASPHVKQMLGNIALTKSHEKCKEILKSNVSNQEKGLIFKEFIDLIEKLK